MREQEQLHGLDQAHLTLMRLLSDDPEMSQRDLSRHLRLSLGKTHYLIRALVEKGLVKAQNFRRSNNKMAYMYLLTPRGMAEKGRLTRNFLQLKEAEFKRLQQEIASLREEVRQQDT